MRPRALAFVVLGFFAATASAQQLTPGTPIAVRILYDNSGSMYPGYRPPGTPDRMSRQELGARYFHQTPQFAEWLNDFVQRQTIVDGGTVGMWTFTSYGSFSPSDIQEVHPPRPIAEFNVQRAIAAFPPETGDRTYLRETIGEFTRDFTGLVWLITDNIVESNAGEPDAGVQNFFESLASGRNLRSVHLFKYTFNDDGLSAAIAVYGILVSNKDVPSNTLGFYDGKFRRLADAKRVRGTGDLFPGHEYLKLKDLHVDPLRPELRLVLAEGDNGSFREGQSVKLDVQGAIRSYLTQHTVTGGRYELAIASPFQPEDWAARNLSAQSLQAGQFDPASADLEDEIPPNGSRSINATLQSRQPVSFSVSGLTQWLRLAWNGATVRYNGTVRMSFTGVTVRLEQRRMAGIFGIDHATSAFEFQNVSTLPTVTPSVVPVSFVLRTGPSRTAILVLILAILCALLTSLAFVLSRKRIFRIALSREPERVVALGPLRTHDILLDGQCIGRLSRGVFRAYTFNPSSANDCTISATPEPDVWDVKLGDGTLRRLSIKAEGGGRSSTVNPGAANPRAAPAPPPPSPRNVPPPLPGRSPRIGKP